MEHQKNIRQKYKGQQSENIENMNDIKSDHDK